MNTDTLKTRFLGLLMGVMLICSSPPQLNADPGGTGWSRDFEIPGLGGIAYALLQRGDTVYVGGDFFRLTGLGAVTDWGMMSLNDGSWYSSPWSVYSIFGASIRAFAEDSLGHIYVGGDFTRAAGQDTIQYIFRWDGVQVTTVGVGEDQLNGIVHCIEIVGNKLFVGGEFTEAGGGPAEGLAMWDAENGWQEVGGGLFRQGPPPEVRAFEQLGDTLYVGGAFQRTGFRTVFNLGRYEVSTDSWLPAWGEPNGTVYALWADSSATEWELYVGGDFDSLSGNAANNCGRFGSIAGWRPMGEGTDGPVRAFAGSSLNNMLLGGDFTHLGASAANHVLRFARSGGGSFVILGQGTDGPVHALMEDVTRERSLIGGSFTHAGGQQTGGLVNYYNQGGQWQATSHGLSSPQINDMVSVNDTIYAAGEFEFAGAVPVQNVAMWAPGDKGWTPLGQGPTSFPRAAQHIAAGGGFVYVSGQYDTTGGSRRVGIQRWNGTIWQTLPGPFVRNKSGFNPSIQCLEVDAVGNLFVGGIFDSVGSIGCEGIAEYVGAWIALGSGMSDTSGEATVLDIAYDTTNNLLYAVGQFTRVDTSVAYGTAFWDGSAWTGIGTDTLGFWAPTVVTVDANGGVYAASRIGQLDFRYVVSKWDGANFRGFGTFASAIHDLVAVGCELYVGGKFGWVTNQANVASRIVRYDGASWRRMGTGMASGQVNAVAVSEWAPDDFRLYAGGTFRVVDGAPASGISYWHVQDHPDSIEQVGIVSPSANDTLKFGDVADLEFNTTAATIYVEYSLDSGATWTNLGTRHEPDPDRPLRWIVPDTNAAFCQVRATDVSSSCVAEPSTSGTFTITKQPGLGVTRLFRSRNSLVEPYHLGDHNWKFCNCKRNMWPPSVWGQNEHPKVPGIPKPRPSAFPSWDTFVDAFGPGFCYVKVPAVGDPVIAHGAYLMWLGIGNLLWNGSCVGMAVSSMMAFRYQNITPGVIVPDLDYIHDKEIVGLWRDNINRLWLHQFGLKHLNWSLAHFGDPASITYELTRLGFDFYGHHPRALSFFRFKNDEGNTDPSGHTVLPYMIRNVPDTAGLIRLYIYDNNYPDDTSRHIRMNLDTDRWFYDTEYEDVDDDGNPETKGTLYSYATDHMLVSRNSLNYNGYAMDPVATSPTASPAAQNDFRYVLPDLNQELLLTDLSGLRIGSDSGLWIWEDSSVWPIVPLDPGYTESVPLGYFLNPKAIHLSLSAFEDSSSHVAIIDRHQSFDFRRHDAAPGETDELILDTAITVVNPDAAPKIIQLLAVQNDVDREWSARISGVSLATNDSLGMGLEIGGDLEFTNRGGAKTYDLLLVYGDSLGLEFGQLIGVPLPANTNQRVIANWQDPQGSPIQILDDKDGDGIYEDTTLMNVSTAIDFRDESLLPADFELRANYPNPFNPSTTIEFSLPVPARVRVEILNVLGQRVRILSNSQLPAGHHKMRWNGRDERGSEVASGMYFYRLSAGEYQQVRKMLLLR